MCLLLLVVIILVIIAFGYTSEEKYGRGGPLFDFLPTVGEIPTGEGGYVDEAAIP